MSFTADQKNINEILSCNFSYEIPSNQRKYVWGEIEWEEFFEDIFEIEQTEEYSHFIGSIVLKEDEKDRNKFLIIDGQQRIITITILYCVLANYFNLLNEVSKKESILKTFIFYDDDGEINYKVSRSLEKTFLDIIRDEINKGYLDTEKAEEQFKLYFKRDDYYNKKILDCFLKFTNLIDEFVKKQNKTELELTDILIKLKKKLSNVQAIVIKVKSTVDGFVVFETLNSRGIPLEKHELILNFIYRYTRTKLRIENTDLKRKKIVDNLNFGETNNINTFIRHYCIHCYGKIPKNDEFRCIRDNTDKRSVDELVDSLLKNSINYNFILNPINNNNSMIKDGKIIDALFYFKQMNISQVRPLLLSLFEIFDNNKCSLSELSDAFELLEIFYFLFSTLGKSTTNVIDNSIATLAQSIHESNRFNLHQIYNELKQFIKTKDDLILYFKNVKFSKYDKKYSNSSKKKIVNYIFTKIESYLAGKEEIKVLNLSIEHILDDSEKKEVSYSLGNLLPLSVELNNKCNHLSFKDKLIYYGKSTFKMTLQFYERFKESEQRNEEQINKRLDYLTKECFLKIWYNKFDELGNKKS